MAELVDIGRNTSTTRTAAQTETVRFFTDQTFVQYSRGLRAAGERAWARPARVGPPARVRVGGGQRDTMIACWEAKFHYYLWRPNHAIQRADTDGNPATRPDPTWLPLVTGNHPEYPSGHACMTAAITKSLQQYFGTKQVELTLTSTTTGTSRTYERLGEVVEDVENARVWGGLHYRTTMTETAKHFPRIAKDVGKEHFLAHADDRDEEERRGTPRPPLSNRGKEGRRCRRQQHGVADTGRPEGAPLSRGRIGEKAFVAQTMSQQASGR